MPNSNNTAWIVSYVLWRPTHEGIPDILNCDSRSFRSERYANDRYKELIKSFRENGFMLREIAVDDKKDYFGYRLRSPSGAQGVVFIDRNPVYTQY